MNKATSQEDTLGRSKNSLFKLRKRIGDFQHLKIVSATFKPAQLTSISEKVPLLTYRKTIKNKL